MAGINQGTPEVAVGEPLRLGSNNDYELEHDPVTDRLIVRDTVNGTEAYVRPETNKQLAGNGSFLRALINGEVLADDGRTYSSLQNAEEAANGWMFVPPSTQSLGSNFTINTDGLTLIGAGYASEIDTDVNGIVVNADDVLIKDMRLTAYPSSGTTTTINATSSARCVLDNLAIGESNAVAVEMGPNGILSNSYVGPGQSQGVRRNDDVKIVNNTIDNVDFASCIQGSGNNTFEAFNIIKRPDNSGIEASGNNQIIIGNRIIDTGDHGVLLSSTTDAIVADNRISETVNAGVSDNGTNTLLDNNLSQGSN